MNDPYLTHTGMSMDQLVKEGCDREFLEAFYDSYDHSSGSFGSDFIALYMRPSLLNAAQNMFYGQSVLAEKNAKLLMQAMIKAADEEAKVRRLRNEIDLVAVETGYAEDPKDVIRNLRRKAVNIAP